MIRALGATDLGALDAASWPRWTAALLAAGRPRLAVARLTGSALALGRFQRASTTLTGRGRSTTVVRRLTGGRAIALGPGLMALALALPHRSWLTDALPGALPASRFLNRAVRGLLSGFATLGCGAHYFGRDFVTAGGGQAAYLSFELDAAGHALLECIVAVDAHWWLPAEHDAQPPRPPRRGVPEPARVTALAGIDGGRLLDAMGQGYAQRFPLSVVPDETPLAPLAWEEPEADLPGWSPPLAVPVGFIEAGVALRERTIEAAALRGDFLADSPSIRRIEARLAGGPATLHAAATAINETFHDPAHAIAGVPDLSVWAAAFRQAGLS